MLFGVRGHRGVQHEQGKRDHRAGPAGVETRVALVLPAVRAQIAEQRHLAPRLRHLAQPQERLDAAPAEPEQLVDRVRLAEQPLGEVGRGAPGAGGRERAHPLLILRHVLLAQPGGLERTSEELLDGVGHL